MVYVHLKSGDVCVVREKEKKGIQRIRKREKKEDYQLTKTLITHTYY
jgi:hypothetical protein